ncbi:hypothetical protein SCATT_22110 [Streptantibioticus cattleyicolor NRRL 8057 = DSM 46488]|uniref:Uncharacterized protein n=1 Tax=Streptantibioticus cattleyicolor (strain ATCC 35852 / DSM 46488 / JCM 4925 / NBRC 14057 / NRRL 8057) TaxID=1003195 RepID=G8WP80_STREN|nr:hypothetical protein SCATT_22110 [Streptantibioticus cattleyicolor NRRL 8057 = DSM 46488]
METRRRQGECPICVGEQAPCQVIRRIVERYKNQPYFPL